jgi:hypothetical protein
MMISRSSGRSASESDARGRVTHCSADAEGSRPDVSGQQSLCVGSRRCVARSCWLILLIAEWNPIGRQRRCPSAKTSSSRFVVKLIFVA